MEYYILKEAVDTKETGSAFPQAVFKNQKKLNPNPFLLANMAKPGEYPPDDILPFDYLELSSGAKLSDLMTSPFSMNGFLISKKLKELFEQEKVTDCRYYPVILYNKEQEVKDYFYFHSVSCLRDYVDYSKSKFSAENSAGAYLFDLPICNNYNEVKELKTTLNNYDLAAAKQLYLKSNFPFSKALFRIRAFELNFFITRKLNETMEANKITGTLILPTRGLIKAPNLN